MSIIDQVAADQAAVATAQAALDAANATLAADQAKLAAVQPHLTVVDQIENLLTTLAADVTTSEVVTAVKSEIEKLRALLLG